MDKKKSRFVSLISWNSKELRIDPNAVTGLQEHEGLADQTHVYLVGGQTVLVKGTALTLSPLFEVRE